jgi:hypothetical protein
MSTPVRIGGFVAVLGVLFAAAFGLGRLVDDDDARPTDGYSLRLVSQQAEPSPRVSLSFAVLDPDEKVVTDFDVKHTKRLHLIAVAKDFSGYRHLHPTMTPAGTWKVSTDLSGGAWRLFADFKPAGGADTVATADHRVSGPTATPATTVPGYQVRLSGALAAGGAGSTVTFTVSDAAGRPVRDLQSYLGSYGHLVAIGEKDLSYLHVHPEPGAAGPQISFHVEVPEAGRYRLYLDFRHRGTVRTAPFVLDATRNADTSDTGDMGDMGGMDHGDH